MMWRRGQSQTFRRFALDEQAVSATEYAIMLALIVLVAMAAIGGIGSRMINIYQEINTAIPDAA